MELQIIGIVLAGIAAFAAFCVYQNRKNKERLLWKIRTTWGTRPVREYTAAEFDAIGRYFAHKDQRENTIDDITWNDLDMDTIFMLLNHTWSCIGESYLYAMLRTPESSVQELQERERLIRYFSENEAERERMEYFFAKIGKTGGISIFDGIYNLAEFPEESKTSHIACIVLFLTAIASMMVYPAVGVLVLVGALGFNWGTYISKRRKIEMYMTSCRCLLEMLRTADQLQKIKNPVLAGYQEKIEEARRKFDRFKRNTFFVLSGGGMDKSGDLIESLMTYVNMTLHTDLIQFSVMVRELRKNLEAFESLTDHIGILESALAIASFREMMQEWSVPKLERTKRVYLRAEEVYHPMIDEPVKNSISVRRGVLLTGSNASGKSTFLKTIAINAVLAQTIHTVLADVWEGNFCRVYSSMSLRDDLMSQESYYIVEIKSLKRILDRMEDEIPLLCFVDEVLRGTNTVERIAASAQILKSMSREAVMCFAATHDIELTYMLETEYENYHFQEEVKEDDILFNYRLYQGRASSRNAIRLLGIMGYEEKIIEAAERSAKRFVECGEWRTG